MLCRILMGCRLCYFAVRGEEKYFRSFQVHDVLSAINNTDTKLLPVEVVCSVYL